MKRDEERETTESPHDYPCHGPVHLDQLPGTLQAPHRTALLPSLTLGRASPVPGGFRGNGVSRPEIPRTAGERRWNL
jgi:hypothetical protein